MLNRRKRFVLDISKSELKNKDLILKMTNAICNKYNLSKHYNYSANLATIGSKNHGSVSLIESGEYRNRAHIHFSSFNKDIAIKSSKDHYDFTLISKSILRKNLNNYV